MLVRKQSFAFCALLFALSLGRRAGKEGTKASQTKFRDSLGSLVFTYVVIYIHVDTHFHNDIHCIYVDEVPHWECLSIGLNTTAVEFWLK